MPLYRRGVTSIAKSGAAKIRGDATLTGGTNVTLTEAAQDVSVAVPDSTTTYKNGVDTRAGNAASGVQNVAHGLGKVPKRVRITTNWDPVTGDSISECYGIYNGVTASFKTWVIAPATTLSWEIGNGSTIIKVFDQNGDTKQEATITVDATNIILNWTNSASANPNLIIFIWEAEG